MSVGEDVEKWESSHIAGAQAQWAATLESSLAVPRRVKRRVTDHVACSYHAIVLLGIYPGERKTCPHKDFSLKVHSRSVHNSHQAPTPRMSTS